MSYDDEALDRGPWDEGYDFAHAELTEYPVFRFLNENGDEIEQRAVGRLTEASSLLRDGYPGAALVVAITAIEITIREFLLRPLLQGAFLSEEIANALMERILPDRPADRDRRFLPGILRAWGIEISHVNLPDGPQLWSEVERLTRLRHAYAHAGEAVAATDAELAMICARELMNQIVLPVSEKVGLKRRETGSWKETRVGC